MDGWQITRPPMNTLLEVMDAEGRIMTAKAIPASDGVRPHWDDLEGTLYHPSYFKRWRYIDDDIKESNITEMMDTHDHHLLKKLIAPDGWFSSESPFYKRMEKKKGETV